MLQRSLRTGPRCHHRWLKPCRGRRLECHMEESLSKMHDPLGYIFLIDQHEFEEPKTKACPIT